jgi:alpha-galactosidase
MGFNNWARFMCSLNESLIVNTAEVMASNGLLAAGYDRINLDDCWTDQTAGRAPDGNLQWDTTKFPQGIPWLASKVREMGFHFGIYADAGLKTCGNYTGSLGYEELDAKRFSDWGVDYLKLDGCVDKSTHRGNETWEQEYKAIYGKWHKVLTNLTKPIIFSESAPAYFSGGIDFPILETNKTDWFRSMIWASTYGELARHSNDIHVHPDSEPEAPEGAEQKYYLGNNMTKDHYWKSVMLNYDYNLLLARFQQPGFYNDPDFIIGDWPGLSLTEKKTQFALWASFSAPLIISADVRSLSKEQVAYLTNKDIIAVDQDALALQATLVSRDGTWDVLTKSLSNGDRVLTVLNRGNRTASTNINVQILGLPARKSYLAKDLWTGSKTEIYESINLTLRSHATAMYQISGIYADEVIPTGVILNSAGTGSADIKCLTATNTNSTFSDCKSTDSQVWRVTKEGTISPLSAGSKCLRASRTGLDIAACDPHNARHQWKYLISGNIVNIATELCLTDLGSKAGMRACKDVVDNQVFGLPTGVKVIR